MPGIGHGPGAAVSFQVELSMLVDHVPVSRDGNLSEDVKRSGEYGGDMAVDGELDDASGFREALQTGHVFQDALVGFLIRVFLCAPVSDPLCERDWPVDNKLGLDEGFNRVNLILFGDLEESGTSNSGI